MIQKQDDKKKVYEPFKLKALMLDLDEYMRVFIMPQVPKGFKDYRDLMNKAIDQAWREMLIAATTTKRERQRHLANFRTEMSMVEVYLKEIRDVCYRGKEKKKLDNNSVRRFEVCAEKHKAVMAIVWAWIKNENEKLDVAGTQKTAGLLDKEEI